jgi:hypothetical protein
VWGAYRRQFFSVPWKEPVSELCSRATISAAALAERYSRTQSPSAAAAAERLMILADPNAARFCERSGAVRIGKPPSDAVPGLLPPYEIRPDPTLHEPRPGGRKWQPAWNSLIRTKTSLIGRFNCLLGRNNFPVPACR